MFGYNFTITPESLQQKTAQLFQNTLIDVCMYFTLRIDLKASISKLFISKILLLPF